MLKRSWSSDSWEFPWEAKRKRPMVVPQSQSGRDVTFTGFLMCFVSVLLLTCGLILLGISVWSLLRKIPYSYLIDIKVDVPYFAIPASCICFPCFWISMSIHNNKKNYEFLHLLILLLVISIALLITGSSLGFIFLARVNMNTTTSIMITSIKTHDLNTSLHISLIESDVNTKYAIGWEKMQPQLHCCGVRGYKDYLNLNRTLPSSCCRHCHQAPWAPCLANNTYLRGCLDSLSRDLTWHLNVLNSQCYMVIVIQVMTIILAATVFITQKIINHG